MMEVNWEKLRELAVAASKRAYAPYSGYPVGVAGVTTDGRYYSGCNVENASTGLGLCAECGMVSALTLDGGGQLAAVLCVNGNEDVIGPCGRCRQLIREHGADGCLIEMGEGPVTIEDLLPYGFGAKDLAEVKGAINIL
ncbi:cytidine deaminase [Arcanobacterium canis]|uniref:Cytidine deaminase n=1 Tax=Arcanobacterium canis TaxID=999183 RepID=A0ABY8G1E4_9ACTO|nr:cytidine deaminase [Arcanobacterium canis]WFM83863.1 cytidine deaminase [Arcanobacterium canis]